MSDSVQTPEDTNQKPDGSGNAHLRGLGVLAILWAVVPMLGGFYLLARLGWASEELRSLADAASIVYIIFFAVTSGLGLMPTYAQAFLGGWVFGAWLGTAWAVVGIVLGGLIGFLIARVVGRRGIEVLYERRPDFVSVRDALVGRGWLRTTGIVALLRLSPNSPFALMNLAMGAARTPTIPYLVGTGIGILPRTAIATTVAAAAASDGSTNLVEVVRSRGIGMTIAGVAVLIVAFVIVGAIGKHALKRVTQVPSRTNSDDASI